MDAQSIMIVPAFGRGPVQSMIWSTMNTASATPRTQRGAHNAPSRRKPKVHKAATARRTSAVALVPIAAWAASASLTSPEYAPGGPH